MKILLLSLFLLNATTSFSQKTDTIWYNSKWEKTEKSNRFYYRVVKWEKVKEAYYVRDFYPSGVTQMEGYYTSMDPEIRHGDFKWWFEDGRRQREAVFKNDSIIKVAEWDAAGNLKDQKELVQTVSYKDGEPIYEIKSIEVAPVYPGGNSALFKFLSSNINYSSKGKKGARRMIVRFVINDKGKVVDPEVLKGIDPLLDREALRALSLMPAWEPGKQGGKNVSVKFAMPIVFE
jgi:periplasmic protein TonB